MSENKRRLPLSMYYELDDVAITDEAFRVYAHLCRRGMKEKAWPSYTSIGEHCFRRRQPYVTSDALRRKAIRCVRELEESGLIRVKRSDRTSNEYYVQSWEDCHAQVSSFNEKMGIVEIPIAPKKNKADVDYDDADAFFASLDDGERVEILDSEDGEYGIWEPLEVEIEEDTGGVYGKHRGGVRETLAEGNNDVQNAILTDALCDPEQGGGSGETPGGCTGNTQR